MVSIGISSMKQIGIQAAYSCAYVEFVHQLGSFHEPRCKFDDIIRKWFYSDNTL